jgi:cytochrome c-type biogenesis protein CcmE
MLKRNWKRIGIIIVIVACIFNVMGKLINKLSLNKEMLYSAEYMQEQQNEQNQK